MTHDDARALLLLYRTTPDQRVRARANAMLCAFIEQYSNPRDVVEWLLDVYVTLDCAYHHQCTTREKTVT